ncbi:hypothetical protein B484DRAFT_408078 [Ochromonadaceae sp. CCMP2298]|nr:hypothetical protein B484DRAFT_408078 [Ochromonadaceae sp. CCMP2298]
MQFSTFLITPSYDNRGNRQAVLMCQVIGAFAAQMEAHDDRWVAQQAVGVLRRMFGQGGVPDAVGCCCSRWGSDAYARGSWSYHQCPTAGGGGGGGGGARASTAATSADAASAAASKHSSQQLKEQQRCVDMRVFYAGEAMSLQHRGTVHGAHMAGQQEARRLLAALTPIGSTDA